MIDYIHQFCGRAQVGSHAERFSPDECYLAGAVDNQHVEVLAVMPRVHTTGRTTHSRGVRNDTNHETRIGRRIKPEANGCFSVNGSRVDYPSDWVVGPIHRFVWETLHGALPEGWHVHHRCGRKWCVNPEHLLGVSASDHAAAHTWRKTDESLRIQSTRRGT